MFLAVSRLLCATNRQNRDFLRKVQRPTGAGSHAGAVAPIWLAVLPLCGLFLLLCTASAQARHAVPEEHPRLLGSAQRTAGARRAAAGGLSARRARARDETADAHARMISLGLVYVVEGDEALGQQAKQLALQYVRGPIQKGHVTFGHDLARLRWSTTCATLAGPGRSERSSIVT